MWYKPWALKWAFRKKNNDFLGNPTLKPWAKTLNTPAPANTGGGSNVYNPNTGLLWAWANKPWVFKGWALDSGMKPKNSVIKPLKVNNNNMAQNAWANTTTPWHKRGGEASTMNTTTPWYINTRNTNVANDLKWKGTTSAQGVQDYLNQQAGYAGASAIDRKNTFDNIMKLLNPAPVITPTDGTPPVVTTNLDGTPATDPVPTNVDGTPQTGAEISPENVDAQNQIDLVNKKKEDEKYMKEMNEKTIKIQNLEWDIIEIQSSATLANAKKQLDNLRQQVGYLGSGWQPWVSAGRMNAIGDQITQAEKTFADIKSIETYKAQMRELGIEIEADQFERQLQDLQYNLDQQVSTAVQKTINEFNQLDANWQLDTVEQVNKVRESIHKSLDMAVGNIALSNFNERKILLDKYNDALTFGKEQMAEMTKQKAEYAKNANTVNMDMSTAKQQYVDWNGNAILWADWQPIPFVEAPMKPSFENGMLTTFYKDKDWRIVANAPQKVYDPTMSSAAMIDVMKWINEGTISVESAKKLFPSMASAIDTQMSQSNTNTWYTWPTIPPATNEKLTTAYSKFTSIKDWSVVRTGECGAFVNDFIKDATGITQNLFIDPIDIRATQTNREKNDPAVGSVVVMRSSWSPDATKYWHVAIVTWISKDWKTISIKEQNGAVKWKVGTRTIPVNDQIVWYFDPAIGLQAGQDNSQDLQMQAMWLTLWLWGTEWERAKIQENLVKVSQKDWITLQEAKKKLWYSTPADDQFKKNMNEQYDGIRKAGTALSQVRSAITALNNPNATTDLVWIVGMLKSIDPNSVARSDEVANVEKARSVLDSFVNSWEKLKSGKKLTNAQRKQLQDAMRVQVQAYEDVEWSFVSEVSKEYENRGLNPKDLFTQSKLDKYKRLQDIIDEWNNVANTLLYNAPSINKGPWTPTGGTAPKKYQAR